MAATSFVKMTGYFGKVTSAIYDFSDPSQPSEWGRIELTGDLDTLTPIGNIAVASVDDDANPGQSTAVVPWLREPECEGPRVELTSPADGDTWVPTTSQIGLSFDEMVEGRSVTPGSLRVWSTDGTAVPGRFYSQENIVNFVPDESLAADATYIVQVPAGGIVDSSGNPTEAAMEFRFSTGAEVDE